MTTNVLSNYVFYCLFFNSNVGQVEKEIDPGFRSRSGLIPKSNRFVPGLA